MSPLQNDTESESIKTYSFKIYKTKNGPHQIANRVEIKILLTYQERMRYLILSCTKVLQWFSSKLAKYVGGRFSVSPHDNHNKCCENSRSQIVFRTDIFRKSTLGAPDKQTSH